MIKIKNQMKKFILSQKRDNIRIIYLYFRIEILKVKNVFVFSRATRASIWWTLASSIRTFITWGYAARRFGFLKSFVSRRSPTVAGWWANCACSNACWYRWNELKTENWFLLFLWSNQDTKINLWKFAPFCKRNKQQICRECALICCYNLHFDILHFVMMAITLLPFVGQLGVIRKFVPKIASSISKWMWCGGKFARL